MKEKRYYKYYIIIYIIMSYLDNYLILCLQDKFNYYYLVFFIQTKKKVCVCELVWATLYNMQETHLIIIIYNLLNIINARLSLWLFHQFQIALVFSLTFFIVVECHLWYTYIQHEEENVFLLTIIIFNLECCCVCVCVLIQFNKRIVTMEKKLFFFLSS